MMIGAMALGLFGIVAPSEAFAACIPSPGSITYSAAGQTSGSMDITACDTNFIGLYKVQNENTGDPAVGDSGQSAAYNTIDTGAATYLAAWDNLSDTYTFKFLAKDSGFSGTTDTISLWTATNTAAADLNVRIAVTLPSSGPAVTSVSPTAGPLGGGTTVTIAGSGFSAAAATGAVLFGATAATYTINSDTQITATSPAHAAGQVDVTVTAGGVTSSTVAGDKFTYTAAPVASSFTASVVVYNTGSASATTIGVTGHVTNSPTGYAVGSATTAQGGSVSINSSGLASYTPPVGFRGNDSFTYTATNSGGTSSPATVTVPVANPTITISPTTMTAGSYGTAYSQSLTASGGKAPYTFSTTLASGSLPAGLTLSSSGTISGTPTTAGSFSFTVTGTDSSTGTGPATFTSSTISLTVNAVVPGAPTIGTATGGNGQATVSFSSPTSNGGAAITGYTVTSSPGGFTGSSTGSPITVTGLSNGTAYTFTVKATNSVGAGSASAASNAVTPSTVPGAPTIGTAAAGNGQATVSFTAPASNGGSAITAYTVTSNPGGFTGTGTGSPITVTGLTNGTSYTFTVTATNANGTGSTSAASNAVTPSTVPGAPTIGTATAGNGQALVSFTAPASNGGSTITDYTVTANPGGFTGTGSASPIVVAGLTNGTAYTFTVTATNGVGTGSASAASNSVTPAPPLQAPVANAVTSTVAANSSANPITLNLTGGAAASVAIAASPTHGTASASGVSITYTPTAGYSGADSFTYTATNTTGTSAAATVSVTVSAPSLTFTPAAGTLTAGTVGTAYNQAIAAASGTAPYTYAVTAGTLPSGLLLNTSAGSITGTPTANGTFNFTITATDANNATGSAAYALTIGVQAPVANAVTATVAANSSANPITLDISGGAAASVAVASNPAHGTATASGTSITYTPTAGYSGADSFTYTATNATGTSTAATVTITISAPTITLAPSAGSLSAGTVNTAYSQSVVAAGGNAPYTYSITAGALPTGLTLNGSTGSISGTPTTDGTFNFTIRATDANNATGSAGYTITIRAAATFVFAPSSGALKDAMVGEDYSQPITARGGSGSLIFSLASGTLPRGLTLNVSTGELVGPLASDAEAKEYNFAIQVRDQNGAVGTAAYTLTVKARSVTVTDQTETVAAGATPNNVDITRGATGGPFISADLVSVEPANAGTVSIVRGEFAQATPPTQLGWYLKYIPNPAYSGQVRVAFRLTSALGNSNTGTVTYTVAYDPAQVATEIDGLVRDFVRARQSLIASNIKVPGLLERRQMEASSNPVTARVVPSEAGMTVNFSTSLAQMRSARDGADGIPGGDESPFNIWIDGAFLAHKDKSVNGSKWGSFAMLNAGVDYLVSEKTLLGLSFHYDRMTDPTDADAELTGNGWLGGPYASLEIGKNVFWNASLLYGGSSNDISTDFWDGTFETRRFLADTSVEGQWDLGEETVLSPKLRVVYFSEDVKDYAVKNSADDTITIDGFNEEQFRTSLGAEIAKSFTLDNGTKLTPKLGLTGGFSGLDGSGAFGSVTAGMSVQTADMWMLDASLLFDIEGEGERSVGAKVAASKRF